MSGPKATDLVRIANADGSDKSAPMSGQTAHRIAAEANSRLIRADVPGNVYFLEPLTPAEIAARKRNEDLRRAGPPPMSEGARQVWEDNHRPGGASAPSAPAGPRGLGQTSADLRQQIQPYSDIPLFGSEEAVFQGGGSVGGQVGPSLPRVPGVKWPNRESERFIGQNCRDEGEISLGRWSKTVLERMGVKVSVDANVCINVPQAVKKAAGEGADAILDAVQPVGDAMNEGRLQRLGSEIDKQSGGGG